MPATASSAESLRLPGGRLHELRHHRENRDMGAMRGESEEPEKNERRAQRRYASQIGSISFVADTVQPLICIVRRGSPHEHALDQRQ